jgi:hypothetical protein
MEQQEGLGWLYVELRAVILSAQADTTPFHKWKNDISWRSY